MTAIPRLARQGRELVVLHQQGALSTRSDTELLERIRRCSTIEEGQPAWEVLIVRHGRLVLSVCQAILQDRLAAEDAFQATFLVLIRKANTIWVGESLAPWLCGVARKIARRAAKQRIRRATVSLERDGLGPISRSADPSTIEPDELIALREEIAKLPNRFRVPVELCHLRGLTHDQAAEAIGCPVGTVRSRLARGRDRLRSRLTQRGISASVAFTLGQPSWPSIPGTTLLHSTTRLLGPALGVGGSGGSAIPMTVTALSLGASSTMMITMTKWVAITGLTLILGGVGSQTLLQNQGRIELSNPPGTSVTETEPNATSEPRQSVSTSIVPRGPASSSQDASARLNPVNPLGSKMPVGNVPVSGGFLDPDFDQQRGVAEISAPVLDVELSSALATLDYLRAHQAENGLYIQILEQRKYRRLRAEIEGELLEIAKQLRLLDLESEMAVLDVENADIACERASEVFSIKRALVDQGAISSSETTEPRFEIQIQRNQRSRVMIQLRMLQQQIDDLQRRRTQLQELLMKYPDLTPKQIQDEVEDNWDPAEDIKPLSGG